MLKGQAGSEGSPCPSLTPGRVPPSGMGGVSPSLLGPLTPHAQFIPLTYTVHSLVLADKG